MGTKDYGGWHAQKLMLNNLSTTRYFYEREIWWVAIGHNIGSEEDGKGRNFARPVLILVKFNQGIFFGIPLSTTSNSGKYYYPVTAKSVPNKALLSQLRAYDAKRLINKMDILNKQLFLDIRTKMADIIKPPHSQG